MSKAGGKHIYKQFCLDSDGLRYPKNCKRWESPDLMSSYFVNFDGSHVLRYLAVDVDFSRTNQEFIEESKVSHKKIMRALNNEFHELARQIEYSVVSHSGRGLHLIIGLTPMILSDESLNGQMLAKKVHSQIVDILIDMGIGADPACKGRIKADFSTFRNREKVEHHNRILTQKIENAAKLKPYMDESGAKVLSKAYPRMLSDLSKACDKQMKNRDLKNGYRLYNDLRVEKSLARLFLFLMGMSKMNDVIKTRAFRGSHENQLELTLTQIEQITETSRRNFANHIMTDEFKKLFNIEKTSGNFEEGCYNISLVDCKLDKRIKRSFQVLSITKLADLRLIHPSEVMDGSINTCIVSWVLALKHTGVSFELALQKTQELVKLIPDAKTSRACRSSQVKCTVSSLYRNRKESHGTKLGWALPAWMDISNLSQNKPKWVLLEQDPSDTINTSRKILLLTSSSPKLSVVPPISELEISSEFTQGLPGNPHTFLIEKKKIYVVRYNKRVGFFLDKKLILLVVKNRHYKFTKIVEHIETNILKNNSKLDILRDVVHVRHNMECYSELSKQLYVDGSLAIKADQICGYREYKAVSIEEHRVKKNLSSLFEQHLEMHEGAKFEYDESMFQELSDVNESFLDI